MRTIRTVRLNPGRVRLVPACHHHFVGWGFAHAGSGRAASVFSTVTIRYEVDDSNKLYGETCSASITLKTPTGTSQQSISLPLRSKSTGTDGLHLEFGRGDFVYVSAQNKQASGSIMCQIYADGVLISSNTANGGYAIVQCEDRAQ